MTSEPRPRSQRPHLPRLRLLAGAAAVLAAAAAQAPTPGAARVPAPAAQDTLRDPVTVRSVNGVLTATLVVDTATLRVPTSATGTAAMNLRSYRLAATTDPAYQDSVFTARFPGPTFRVKPGDLVQIKLVNSLPPLGPAYANDRCQPYSSNAPTTIPDTMQGCFHGPESTNIHYHGMHVTPDSVGDDVLLQIPPDSTYQYSFRIPQNQSPGTHWYHPHKHGSVAVQVVNGMAGAIIVEDTTRGLDSIVVHHGMREHLIAIQQIDSTVGMLPGGTGLDALQPLINGQYQPEIVMGPGEVQRWRIVNENVTRTSKTFDVGFVDRPGEEPKLFDIARDGVQFAPANYSATVPDTFLHMAPGQRLDVFVQAPPAAGTYTFRVAHVPGTSKTPRSRRLAAQPGAAAAAAGPTALFTVRVDPNRTGVNTYLPSTLPELPDFLDVDLPAATDTALIVFTDTLAQNPTQFYLGSGPEPQQKFNDTVVFVPRDAENDSLVMTLGGTQTWKIVNNSLQQISHPFHIHINPFQVDTVVYPRGTADPFHRLYEQLNAAASSNDPDRVPIWLDVLPLPQPDTANGGVSSPAYVVITQRYDDFDGCADCGPAHGYFVMHCHILGHEERGMMQLLEVVKPGDPVTPPSAAAGHAGHRLQAPGAPAARPPARREPERPVRKDPDRR